MTYNIIYETCPYHARTALLDENGKLLTLRFDDPSRPLIEGTIVLGRVRRIAHSLNAAFVDIGDTQDGFLRLNTLPKGYPTITEGTAIMVRITRSASGSKGANLNAKVSVKMPESDIKIPSIIQHAPNVLRRAIMDAGYTPIKCWIWGDNKKDIEHIVPAEKIFNLQNDKNNLLEKLDDQLDMITDPTYKIAGGRVIVEITKALTAIDVDAGTTNAENKQTAIFEINMQAVEEVARLSRLLDLGGNIIVDFITMNSKSKRQKVTEYLKSKFAEKDFAKVEIFPMSRFGLVEINRERRGEMMPKLLSQPNYVAGRILLELWRKQGAGNAKKLTIQATSQVIEILKKPLNTNNCLAYFGHKIDLIPKDNYTPSQYSISG